MLDLQLYSGSIFILAVFYASIDPVVSVKYVGHALIPSRLSEPFIDAAEVSLPTCSALCSIAESCFAVSFHRETMRCELLNKTGYFGEYLLTDNDGWRVYSNVMADTIYTPCSVNEDCLDPNSRCVETRTRDLLTGPAKLCYCRPLFQYKDDKRRCEQVCSSLGSSFTRHRGFYIDGHNIWGQESITLANCKQKCLQQGDNCLSIDYLNTGSSCRVNSISLQDATDAEYLRSDDGDSVYIRDCEN